MIKDKTIMLSNHQTATIVKGDEAGFKNCYIVLLEAGELRVVDRETLTLAETLRSYKKKKLLSKR
ncbi:bacteriocin [Lactococcus lactis]|uniref:bacteriocin n=1 Tax=Lactococcus lactis TaxID=1358 RepID=UPI003877AC57